MKTLKTLALMLLFSAVLFSCGDDDDPNDGNVDCNNSFSIEQEIIDEINAVSAAANAYATNQSMENCLALQAAWQDYVTALGALEDCATQAGLIVEYQMSLAEAQQAIDDLMC